MRVFVESVGILAPGLAGWAASRAVLAGTAPYRAAELSLPNPDVLPAVERRRTGAPVKLAIAVGQDALAGSARSGAELPTVFTSSGSDGEVIQEICVTLAGTERQVSPTRFHNSVHNAPSGYWGIAMRSRALSTSLCAFDWSFAAGLIEAATQIGVTGDAVLLIAYDLPYPEPLRSARPVSALFGAALLLTRDRDSRSIAGLELALSRDRGRTSRLDDAGLESLRRENPGARGLPLLAALARRRPDDVVLEYVAGNAIDIAVSPC
ncbi:MAG: beta-ketoacyl synthase chain length factor [Burkholderiales bacterium]